MMKPTVSVFFHFKECGELKVRLSPNSGQHTLDIGKNGSGATMFMSLLQLTAVREAIDSYLQNPPPEEPNEALPG